MADVRDDLIALQDKFQYMKDLEDYRKGMADPDFQRILASVNAKLENNPTWRKKKAAMDEERKKSAEEDEGDIFNLPDDVFKNKDVDVEDLDSLLAEMKDVLVIMGDGDKKLESDLDALLSQDPYQVSAEDAERAAGGVNMEDIEAQINQVKDLPTLEEEEIDNLSPDLEAKINKIMDDPQLIQKLALIKEIMAQQGNVTSIAQPSAPDPDTLDKSRLTTFKERLRIVENDPEHIYALRRLRINLLPPFNVAPAVKSLNKALRLSYIAANDDVRRILWRAYTKARVVPTLIHNLPNDAWDILWYSQAVNWDSNQNRHNHLKILQRDLQATGRDGPPTHPNSLRDHEIET